jgi:hypothetical protein
MHPLKCGLPFAGLESRNGPGYNGTIHDFLLLNPIANTPAVRAAVHQASGYLGEVFAER